MIQQLQSYGYGLGGLIPLEEMFPLDCVDKPKSVRCRYCKTEGHEISNCPKLLKKKSNDESGLNHLFIGSIESDVTCTNRNIIQTNTYLSSFNIMKIIFFFSERNSAMILNQVSKFEVCILNQPPTIFPLGINRYNMFVHSLNRMSIF